MVERLNMQQFAKIVYRELRRRSVHLYVTGEQDVGKSCWVLSLFLELQRYYVGKRYHVDFKASGLEVLLKPDYYAVFIDESGQDFDSRAWATSIAKVFQWTRIFRMLICLATTHYDNVDVIIRERGSFRKVKFKSRMPRVGFVEGIGAVRAGVVEPSVLQWFNDLEYRYKRDMTYELLSKLDK